MSQLTISTDNGVTKSYHDGDQFRRAKEAIKLDHKVYDEINASINRYWGDKKRPKFYRTREEMESLAGLGEYNKVVHRYENPDSSVIGIEITFEHINNPAQTYLRMRPFTVWDNEHPDAGHFPAMRAGESRLVVRKETIASLVRHIDPKLAANYNQHRAFMLEVTIGIDEDQKPVAILKHVHHFIDDFRCAESHNPVKIPPRAFDDELE